LGVLAAAAHRGPEQAGPLRGGVPFGAAVTDANVTAAEERRVDVVCFLPDPGHVLPLLRLARLVANHGGVRGTCFLAPRFERAAAEHGFDFRPVTSLNSAADGQVFAELSRKSNFYNEFSDHLDLLDRYWAPLFECASRELEPLAANLRKDPPAVLIADSHIFPTYYRMLAAACGARLVLHRASGSLYPYHRPFVRAYGLSDWPAWAQGMVEFAGELHARLTRRWRVWRYPDRVRAAEAARAALDRAARCAFGQPAQLGPEPLRVTSGICVLEDRVAPSASAAARAEEVLLPPITEPSITPLPSEMDGWLAAQSRPVVYVSFGSMVWPEEAMLRNLARGLRDLDIAVLWAQPPAQRGCLVKENLPPDRFYFDTFVPQTALLASGRIACFVTHAGAGSVQESLSVGVPMLCLPFLWDHPYIASVAVRLGVAVRLSRRRLRRREVRAAITELLSNPLYAECSRAFAAELRTTQGDTARLATWIKQVLQPTQDVCPAERRSFPPATDSRDCFG
jgi:UDP:flavonoid glycosyltransferase YjiC (YdhE family)